MRLIIDGVVDREGVLGLAHRMGYSSRQLDRLMVGELGAGPLALARAQRAHTARQLLTETDMQMGDVAFSSGFSSIRQFNDTIQEIFALTPSQIRERTRVASIPRSDLNFRNPRTMGAEPGSVRVTLPFRAPFPARAVLRQLRRWSLPGVERVAGETYSRSMRLSHGSAMVSFTLSDDRIVADIQIQTLEDLGTGIAHMRRMLDLDSDPIAASSAMEQAQIGADLADATPGIRILAGLDLIEALVRGLTSAPGAAGKALIGEMIATASGALAGRLPEW